MIASSRETPWSISAAARSGAIEPGGAVTSLRFPRIGLPQIGVATLPGQTTFALTPPMPEAAPGDDDDAAPGGGVEATGHPRE